MLQNLFIVACFFPILTSAQSCDSTVVKRTETTTTTTCFYTDTKTIGYVKTISRDLKRKWAEHEKYIEYSKAGKVTERTKSKSKLGGDYMQKTRMITWTFRYDGKRRFKRQLFKHFSRLH